MDEGRFRIKAMDGFEQSARSAAVLKVDKAQSGALLWHGDIYKLFPRIADATTPWMGGRSTGPAKTPQTPRMLAS